MSGTGYAFRDTAPAASRLTLLNILWEPSSAPFIGSYAPVRAELAYDLGCGPGWTTRLLTDLAAPKRVVGLDESESFVELARQLHPVPEFSVHDVTRAGFPAGPADLMFCRMLLTHLEQPVAALETWAGELRHGGVLLVDEVEAITTDEPVFARYLELAAGLIGKRGGRLYVGAELEAARPARLRRLGSEGAYLAPDPRSIALLFRMNLRVWRDSPDAGASQGELDDVAAGLRRINSDGGGAITWTMRQIAYEAA
ncbi:MAG TPA: class I SAM-dependent methyltransferase [Candidatus Dormibacteraeota bacterium]